MAYAMARKPKFRNLRKGTSAQSRGFFNWWTAWRVPALVLLVMASWWFILRPLASNAEGDQGWTQVRSAFALCGEGQRKEGCVIDGDTVLLGKYAPSRGQHQNQLQNQQRRIRLTGFDAPEMDGACDAERALAKAARRRLHEWLSQGPFEWSGAGDPPRDTYGRELRAARRTLANGQTQSLAYVMISSGLASETGWGERPRNWCSE